MGNPDAMKNTALKPLLSPFQVCKHHQLHDFPGIVQLQLDYVSFWKQNEIGAIESACKT